MTASPNPLRFTSSEAALQKAREKRAVQQNNVAAKPEAARRNRFSELVGRSEALREVFALIARVAPTDSTVLLMGESGVGKELAARAIHRVSSRGNRPFVVVDCSSLHEELLQSELFGHEKGAFTGANVLKRGLFEVADGATIFLDEIGEFTLPLQARLLRVLENGSFRRLGGLQNIVVNARVITATNRDLPQMVKEGRFREDLFYRINVFSIILPPLRERREDIPVLARQFARRFSGGRALEFSREAMDALEGYCWPGNVRELQNVIERAVILTDGRQIDRSNLPESLQATADGLLIGHPQGSPEGGDWTLKQAERRHIATVLRELAGSRAQVAQALGVSERSLYRKLREYGLSPPSSQSPRPRGTGKPPMALS